MDSKVYKKMLELKQVRNSNDVSFVGTISLKERDISTNQEIINQYDIFLSIEETLKGIEYRFFNKNNELVAINKNDGRGTLPTKNYADIFSSYDLKMLDHFISDPQNSLNQFDANLNEIAKKSGISKEKLLSISETKLSENENTEQNKIHLKEDSKDKSENQLGETPSEETKKIEALEKQETSLGQTVTENRTLGDIMGLPTDCSLVAVHSDDIENSKSKNHTRFTFLLKDKDGNYHYLSEYSNGKPILEQSGGTMPDTTVAYADDMGNVTQKKVNSLYKVNGPGNIQYMLTADVEYDGTVNLGIGQLDKTQSTNSSELSIVANSLKTENTYYTDYESREAINGEHEGTMQATRRTDEVEAYKNCDKQHTEKDADGDENTYSHPHLYEAQIQAMAERIYDSDYNYSYYFSLDDIKEMIENAKNNHHDMNAEEIEAYVTKDCDQYTNMISRNH